MSSLFSVGLFSSKIAQEYRGGSSGPPSVPARSIRELGEWCTDPKAEIRGQISVDGFIAREGAYDVPNQTYKYLLYSSIDGAKKGVFPAVMLFFKKEAWDVEVGVATGEWRGWGTM